MAADTAKPNIKQFRVDNWAVFFLQRLQLLFAKGDQCDLTLKFHTGEELKAHRLILSTCTTYFETLEHSGNVVKLPETLPYNAVHPIINFLYSGRLEFKPEHFDELMSVTKTLNITILLQLLVAQKNDNGTGTTSIAVSKGEVVKKMPVKSPVISKVTIKTPVKKTIEGKKLPIWRQRTALPLYRQFKRMQVETADDDPKPTRFDWPVDDSTNSLLMQSPSFASLSYESSPVIPSMQSTPSSSLPQPIYKRRIISSGPPPLPEKFFKPADKVKDDGNENKLDKAEERSGDMSDDDDGHFETLHTYGDSDDDTPQETVNQLKPILKPSSEPSNPTPNKKVRFSFVPEEKEKEPENENENEEKVDKEPQPATSVPAEKTDKVEPVSNHAKIIAEVLKKYPELVKNNKNIKLKITAPGFSPKTNMISMTTKKSQGKSSYVVIKSSVKPKDGSSKVVDESPSKTSETPTGPWSCSNCGTDDEPIKFNSYFEYRKHLETVHNERMDSRICEYCGYKASKRNLHLFHLYTKHDVPPPKNVSFPKCNQCCYIALSEGLLTKHLNSHQTHKDFICPICNLIFKTATTLQAHSVTCKPENEVRNNTCTYCKKKFRTANSLNVHVKICTEKDSPQGNIFDEDETEENMGVIDVPIIETVKMDDSLVELPSTLILTEQPNVTLLPSSESEALSNVASGIATSIGLTVALPQEQAVILLDSNSEFYIEDHNSDGNSENTEYIVPAMIGNNIYSTSYDEAEISCTIEAPEQVESPKPGTSRKIEQYGKKEIELKQTYSNAHQRISLETPVIFDNELINEEENRVEEEENVRVQETPMEVEQSSAESEQMETQQSDNEEVQINQETEEVKEMGNEDVKQPDVEENIQTEENVQKEENVQNEENIQNEENRETEELPNETTKQESETEIEQEINENHCESVKAKEDEMVKANTLVKDWGFDNDEENEEIVDTGMDPDGKPCRINEDL